jgi:hypothetical protein
VALNDPRLCDIGRFKQLYTLILKHVVSADQIGLVYFENNLTQCVANEKIRMQDSETDCAEIAAYSTKYDKTIAHMNKVFHEDCVIVQSVFVMSQPRRRKK